MGRALGRARRGELLHPFRQRADLAEGLVAALGVGEVEQAGLDQHQALGACAQSLRGPHGDGAAE
jgi:hypothetical protein